MSYHIDIQHACTNTIPVSDETLSNWAISALKPYRESAELTLRLVGLEEITQLNQAYRDKNSATNVLAFRASHSDEIDLEIPLLGDVILCPAVLIEESLTQEKPIIAHCAHIVIHGVLHLLGYDHIKDDDAIIMQAIETELLIKLGFTDPYEEH